MAKKKKIISAGPLRREVIYSAPHWREAPQKRAAKKKISTEAQKAMNLKYTYEKCEYMLAANFIPGDLVICLTYDDAHLPQTLKQTEADLRYFRAKLTKARKTKGAELVALWNTEKETSANKRYHHHMVLNATKGKDYETLHECWIYGNVEIKPLRVDSEKNYRTLAQYLCKEKPDKPNGARCFSYTRNAKKYEVETFNVTEDTELKIPKNALVIMDERKSNIYGGFRIVEYVCLGNRGRGRSRKPGQSNLRSRNTGARTVGGRKAVGAI